MKPRIGITTWLRPLSTYLGEQTLLYTLGYEYVDSVIAGGGLPLLLPHANDPNETLNILDGLLLTGGADVHPLSYNAQHDGTSSGVDQKADMWEIGLVHEAARRGMPVLGICRGMQIMAVAFGGSLLQNLVEVEGHPAMSQLDAEAILNLRHNVVFDPSCSLAAIYQVHERQINTIHHQAVIDAGQMRAVGMGTGNVIEAIEAPEQKTWPALGVQWHPEKMHEAIEERLFTHFVASAAQYADTQRKH